MPGFLNTPGYGAAPSFAMPGAPQVQPMASSPFSLFGWTPPQSLAEYGERSAPYWAAVPDPFKAMSEGIAGMFGVHPDQMPAEAAEGATGCGHSDGELIRTA